MTFKKIIYNICHLVRNYQNKLKQLSILLWMHTFFGNTLCMLRNMFIHSSLYKSFFNKLHFKIDLRSRRIIKIILFNVTREFSIRKLKSKPTSDYTIDGIID